MATRILGKGDSANWRGLELLPFVRLPGRASCFRAVYPLTSVLNRLENRADLENLSAERSPNASSRPAEYILEIPLFSDV